jgi:hypothetical protein
LTFAVNALSPTAAATLSVAAAIFCDAPVVGVLAVDVSARRTAASLR